MSKECLKLSTECLKMSTNGRKSVTFGVNFHSDACSEYPRVSRNVTKTCHKTPSGSERTPVQIVRRFRAYAGSEHTSVQAYTNSEHTPIQRPIRSEHVPVQAYTNSDHTPVQSIHRFKSNIISDA